MMKKKGHVYRYANRAHLEIFFGLNAEDEDYINQIKEKSDTELITEYRVRTQKRHTYGDLCFGSDEYAREQEEAELWKTGDTPVYNFFEMGIIDNKPLILRVSKKPVFKGFNGCNTCVECDKEDGEYCCSIGQAIDITEYFEHEMLDELIKKKLVIKLDNGSYFIRPSKNDPLDFVKKELQI